MVIDARGRVNGETFPDNPLDDRVSLFEHKTLASLKVTVEARANLVRSDLKKRAEDLDARHPGSTFVQELASYPGLMENTLSWSRVPLPTSLATSTPLWISLRGSGPCKQSSFETSDLMLFSLFRDAL